MGKYKNFINGMYEYVPKEVYFGYFMGMFGYMFGIPYAFSILYISFFINFVISVSYGLRILTLKIYGLAFDKK